MKTIPLIISLLISSFSLLPAQILETKIPKVGLIGKTNLREFLPRVQGWAEGQGRQGFSYIYNEPIPSEVLDKKIRISTPDKDSSTYQQMIKLAFSKAGRSVAVSESKGRIVVTTINLRWIELSEDTKRRLTKAKITTSEGITKKVKSSVGDLSEHFGMRYEVGDRAITVFGTKGDVTKVLRFFGHYK